MQALKTVLIPAKTPTGKQYGTTHSFGKDGACPGSTHRKQKHVGTTVKRVIKVDTFPAWNRKDREAGKTVECRNYVDSVVCTCGVTYDQEWCNAF
jgi:hypothetical protein